MNQCAKCEDPAGYRDTRLCRTHYEAVLAEPLGREVAPAARPTAPLPPVAVIDPGDVYDPATGGNVAVSDRVGHLGRWLRSYGKPVRRADACRVAGIDGQSGSARRILDGVVEAGWATRGTRGTLVPSLDKLTA